jgi:LuxR family maltose regulon positive regulatory protein
MRLQSELVFRSEPASNPAHARAAAFFGASLWLRGRAEQARNVLHEAADLAESGAATSIFALGLLGLMYLDARRLDEAQERIVEGFALMERCELRDYLGATSLRAGRACLSIERNDWETARADLEHAIGLLPLAAAMPWWSIWLGVLTGRVARALGRLDRADGLLAQARRELTRYPDAGLLPHLLSSEERALIAAREASNGLCEALTEAELRVLELAPTHLTLEQIGRDRCISRNTVKTHLKAIYSKLDVSSRGEAVARAQALGLLRQSAAAS